MNENTQFNHHAPTYIIFSAGSLSKLYKQKFPGERAILVISSKSSVRGYGILSTVEEQLLIAGIEYVIYDCAGSITNDVSVEKGAILTQKNESDFIIGLGGTRAIDTAKAISFFLFNSGYRQAKLPLWTIPTTAGWGSEINNTCIVWQNKLQKKMYLQNSLLHPDFCLIDPTITQSVSPLVSIQHGFSILFRAIDIYLFKEINFHCKYFASIAIKTLANYLPRIVNSSNDMLARICISHSNMLVSSNSQYKSHFLEDIFYLTEREPEINYSEAMLNSSDAYYTNIIDSGKYDHSFKEIARLMGVKSPIVPNDFLSVLRYLKQVCGV